MFVAAGGPSVEERTAVCGETPLTLAVKAGLVDNVRSLLECGALLHNVNIKNESPLLLGNMPQPEVVLTNCTERWMR